MVGMHQGSVLSSFLANVVDVVTELTRELLYADDFVLMNETIEALWISSYNGRLLRANV